MTDNRTTEPLPCPFCGGEADEYEGEYGNGIYCMMCGAKMGDPIHLEYRLMKRVSIDKAIAAWNTRAGNHHPYEQRIVGDGSDWGEIMIGAYDDLIAAACESCTPEQMRQLADHIRAELVGGTCHGESDLSEWVCSNCQCWIPLGLTPENIKNASEWRYCPHCGAKVKAVKR